MAKLNNFPSNSLNDSIISEWDDALKKNLFTPEDVAIIGIIVKGCTQISTEMYNAAQRRFKRVKRVTDRLIVSLTISEKLLTGKRKFRPAEIRSLLPDDLSNIDSGELTNVLNKCVNTGLIEKTAPPSKRGRPSRKETRYAGAKSYYAQSDYLLKVKGLILRPEVKKILFLTLLKSGAIQKYFFSANLYRFAILKQRSMVENMKLNDLFAKRFGSMISKESEKALEKDRDEVLDFKRRDLKKIAELSAKDWIRKTDYLKDPLLDDFYILGGMRYIT